LLASKEQKSFKEDAEQKAQPPAAVEDAEEEKKEG
jgi:hypothetical protein